MDSEQIKTHHKGQIYNETEPLVQCKKHDMYLCTYNDARSIDNIDLLLLLLTTVCRKIIRGGKDKCKTS